MAHGRYALLLNPDTVILPGTLGQLVAYMDENLQVGAATTTMRFPDGTLQRNGSEGVSYRYLVVHYTWLGKLFPRWRQTVNKELWYDTWDRKSARQVGVLPGSCIIAARETWTTIGGLEARMLMYFSDDYMSWAVRKLGKQTMYMISNGIIHYENASTRKVSKRAARLYFHDMLVYTLLRYGRLAQIGLAIVLIPTLIIQVL